MALMSSGTGTGMDNSISKVWEREGNKKSTSPYNSGTGRDKNPFPEFGNGKEMKKKLIPKFQEQESEVFIPGNDRERKFLLTTDPQR